MQTEIELKLQIEPKDVALLQRHPFLQSAPQTIQLHSIYFDTPELELNRQKMALRLRRVGGQWIQTLKGGGKVEAGLHQRQEWEVPLPDENLNAKYLLESPWGHVFTAEVRQRLLPVFETNFERTIWMVEMETGTIELALDMGEIVAKGMRTPICELELELKSGTVDAITELAHVLRETIPLRADDRSKAERGYKLFLGAQ